MSGESDEELCVPCKKTRARKTMKIKSSDSEENSNEESFASKPLSKVKRYNGESEDNESTPDPLKRSRTTPKARSSERLRKKNSREFRLPSKEEILEQVSPGIFKSSHEKLKELKPRRLVNNFIRERNSYASERVGDIYETDDSLSDFIDDDDDVNEENSDMSDDSSTDLSESEKKKSEKSNLSKKRKQKPSSVSESDSSEPVKHYKKPKTRSKTKNKHKMKKVIDSSSEEDQPDQASLKRRKERDSKTNKKRKATLNRKLLQSSSSDSDLEGKNKDEANIGEIHQEEPEYDKTTVRRSSRRREKIQKEEDVRNQKYGQLIESRKKRNYNPKDIPKKEKNINCKEDLEVFKSLIDNFSTDEDDKDFVVSDKEISVEDMSDSEIVFLKLKDSQSPDWNYNKEAINSSPSKSSIKIRQKQRTKIPKWKRINTHIESNSEDSASNEKEGYNHSGELHSAIKNNDINVVKKILQKDPHCVDILGYRKRSALHLAALNGNAEMVQLLIKSKADVKLQDRYGFPPIAYAANGNSECLKVLLKNTDIKKVHKGLLQTESEMSLLHLAIGETRTGEKFSERGKCLELLFLHDKSACVKMLQHKDARGRTPLEAAVYASQHQCLQILLNNGADPLSFKTDEGGNLLHFAVECASHLRGDVDENRNSSLCLRQLLEPMKLNLDSKDNHDFTPLMYACESGNDDCLLALIEAGASVIIADNFDTSPLHLAAMAGSTECVELLLSHNHPVDCVDKCGWPPLLYADFNAKEECVLALMKPKPEQLFVLGKLLKKQRNEEDKKKTFKVVKNVLMSLANHDAYYTVFNDFIRVNPELLDDYNYGLLQHTWRAILDFNNKRRWFKRRLQAICDDSTCWDFMGPSFTVNRSNVLGSTMQRIGHVLGIKLRNNMNVSFENEPGICTGPKREFFICFCKDAVDPNRGLFVVTDDCQYSPVPNAYFSTYETEVVEVKPSKDVKQEIQKEPHNFNSVSDTASEGMVDSGTLGIEDCTDSELLAIDMADTRESSMDVDDGCTDSELISALYQLTDSGTSTANCVASSSECEESSSEQPSSASNVPASSQEPLDRNENSTSQHPTNTWIPCESKVVIPAIVLRRKMKQIRLIGRLVGSAICQDMLVNLHLSKPFVKQVLGIPLSHPEDLASFDYLLHQTLVSWVQESVNDLDLPFALTAVNPWTQTPVTVNLSDDEDKMLDDSNKHEYIKLVSKFKLETSVQKEVEEFRSGLNEVIPRDLLSFFTADEFSLLLNGVATIDVEDWKKNTKYSGFSTKPNLIKWFWDIVSNLKQEEKALLLKFATGTPCVPIGGFANLRGYSGSNPFTISEQFGKNKIPEASTCFNLLKLTDYDTKKDLREKLLIAIRHGSEGFSFT